MSKVRRFDLARFSSKATKTPQGFLKAPAYFTRAGVFAYERADGTTIHELRPEEEVFHKDSLATLVSAPLTREHPREGMVNPQNATRLAIGFAGERVERKDMNVGGSVTIMEHEAIQDVNAGKLKDISMGYTCTIEATAGSHPSFGRYDQIQRNIRYNHVALGGASWGRAGGDVGLRLDSGGAVQRADARSSLDALIREKRSLLNITHKELAASIGMDEWELDSLLWGFDPPTNPQIEKIASAIQVDAETLLGLVPDEARTDSQPRRKIMEEETIIIGGVEFKVPKNAAQAFRADMKRSEGALTELKAKHEKLQGRFDAQGEELKTSQTKAKKLDDPKRFDTAVQDRVALLGTARKVLGDEAKIAGSAREVREQVLKHDSKDLDLTGKSDDYVEARFDQMMEGFQERRVDSNKARTRTDARKAGEGNGKDPRFDSEAARLRMQERNQNAWKGEQPKT